MTLTASSRFYLSDRCRLLNGIEALAALGIHYGPHQGRLLDFKDSFLVDLAGNAFHGWCCAPTLLCALRLHAEIHSRATASRVSRADSSVWLDSVFCDGIELV
jgi:hypothetical protein